MNITRSCFCVCVAVAQFMQLGCARTEAVTEERQLGVNLTPVSFWSSEIVFVDVFKQSQPWTSQVEGKPRNQGGPLELDAQGWVKKLNGDGHYAEALVFVDLQGHYPGGDYICLFDGHGEIDFAEAATVIERLPGRMVVRVTPADAPITVRLRKTDPLNPVRNIRLVLPGFEKVYREKTFHPDFLKRWADFKAVRLMDWGRTNNSKIVKWSDRTRPDDATQGADSGVALEYQIQLANMLGADPWFCIPHQADDDYVSEFASLVRDNLNKDRKFFVEYSNECWHPGFESGRHCVEWGKQLGLSKQEYEAGLRFYAQRSVEIFKQIERVLGDSSRFVRVLSVQPDSEWALKTILDWKDAAKNVDAIAVAPYFGKSLGKPQVADRTADMSVEQVLTYCRAEIAENAKRTRTLGKFVHDRGLKLLAYEGGQHLVGVEGAQDDEKLTRLFQAVNRDQGMKDVYLEDLRSWREAGGGLYCIFNSVSRFSKWGSWSHLEFADQDETTAPKMLAVREFMKR